MRLDFGGTNFTRRKNDVKMTSSGRRCLNFGFLGFHGFLNNKTRQTKQNVADTVTIKTGKFLKQLTRHASEITLTFNALF